MKLDAMLASIPYLAPLNVELVESGSEEVTVRVPFRREVRNYVGTVHAGALFTVAETAAGVAAYLIIPDEGAIALLRGANIRYTRRAEGDITATARIAKGQAEGARAAFETDQRANAEVEVTIVDPEGETVFEGTFDYALRRRKP
jgi:uncharacterized protein (TIGR00369 family)